jgi:hypothetical protein
MPNGTYAWSIFSSSRWATSLMVMADVVGAPLDQAPNLPVRGDVHMTRRRTI